MGGMNMAHPPDLRKLGSDMDNPPDSWEMADLEERMKKLINVPEAASSVAVVDANVAGNVAIPPIDQVDSVLREVVQNPRFRMTILRLEHEVEGFLRNSKLQELEFQPMRSSYLRLAAHRVAQHYFLQSAAVDSNSAEGSRIIARKTSESSIKYPSIRLADIPVDMPSEDKPSSFGKVAIKQRSTKPSWFGEIGAKSELGMKTNPSKSMEERKEDYNRARQRIFSGSDLVGTSGEEEAIELDILQVKDCTYEPPVHNAAEGSCENVRVSVELCGARVQQSSENQILNRPKANNKVAIFRDHEKDRRDPDYDRNPERYVQHFDPGFGLSAFPLGLQGLYVPPINYNTEFPQLVSHPRQQIYMEQAPPCVLPQQMQWICPVNSLSYRYPENYAGQYSQAHDTPRAPPALHMHSPLVYHGRPSIAYTFSHDHYQQPLSQLPSQMQPHSQLRKQQQKQQQPETSISQSRCR